MKLLSRALLCVFCLVFGTHTVEAQKSGSLEFEIRGGSRDAIVESICAGRDSGQATFSAAFRYHLTARTSIGPEFTYISACDRQVFTFQHPRSSGMLQIVHDFRTPRRVRPYVLAAVGFVHHESQYASPEDKVEAAGGAGVKIFLARRVFLAPELQISGGVATVRSSLGVGFIIH